MDRQNSKNGISRRNALAGVGAAGMAALVGSTSEAATTSERRVTKSELDYEYRRFSKNEKIRVGMIGNVGHINTILKDIPTLPNVDLVAYSEISGNGPDLADSVKIYKTYEEMLDREKLDVVGVCLPYYRNAKASIAAAERGLQIITEKPAATNLDDFAALRYAVVKNKIRLTALLEMRCDGRFQAIHKAVGEGAIGTPILVTAQKSYKFGKSRPDFYKDIETYGGTIPWVGIHAIDYIHYTTRLDYKSVAAFQGNMDHPEYPGCQDYVGTLFSLSNGGTALINMDYLRPETAPSHGDDRLRIIGSEGVIEVKDLGKRVELINSSNEAVDLEMPERISFMTDFITELRGGKQHLLAPEEPLEITRVALLAHQAAEKGMLISL